VVVLFTDFGWQGPYVGLLKLAVMRHAPAVPVIDLCHDVPPFDVQGASYLLAAYAHEFPENTVFVGVIDPGVGGSRAGIIVRADGHVFVGPENGLFDRVAVNAQQRWLWRITWQPERLSASFHGRDLFAPVAAMLAGGRAEAEQLGIPERFVAMDWPDDLARIVYLDRYGNAVTGVRAAMLRSAATIRVGGSVLRYARTFSEVPPGECFWYENSVGLVELACNQSSIVAKLGLRVGHAIELTG
jgi:S-adenosylmethionine hydrolase